MTISDANSKSLSQSMNLRLEDVRRSAKQKQQNTMEYIMLHNVQYYLLSNKNGPDKSGSMTA